MYSQTGKASLPLSQTTCTLRAVLRSKTWSPDKKKKRAEQRATKRCHYRFWRFFDCNEKNILVVASHLETSSLSDCSMGIGGHIFLVTSTIALLQDWWRLLSRATPV